MLARNAPLLVNSSAHNFKELYVTEIVMHYMYMRKF